MSKKCQWCDGPISDRQKYCSKKCRQSAYRFRCRVSLEVSQSAPKCIAYADPPYPGLARKYYEDEGNYEGEVNHKRLLEQLATFDGWALSTSSRALRDILPMCPSDVRVCAWVKPIVASPRTFGLHSTWEPLIVKQARLQRPGVRDWLLCQPARFGGDLIGRKPIGFCAFLFQALGAAPGDDFTDMFPGTGIVTSAWREFSSTATRGDTCRLGTGATSSPAPAVEPRGDGCRSPQLEASSDVAQDRGDTGVKRGEMGNEKNQC